MFSSIYNLPPDELYSKAIIFKDLKDYDNYIVHLTMAANFDHLLAIEYLYHDYRDEHLHKKQNYIKTINFYETTIEYSFSANYLAWMYEHGKGVPLDYNKAIELFQMAIDKGNSIAISNLAFMYEHGKGLPQDYSKAIALYQIAIEKEVCHAMYNLGRIYQDGRGVTKDYDQAIKLYKMAISKGNSHGMFALALMYQHGMAVTKDYNVMKKYYIMAIDMGHPAEAFLRHYYLSNLDDLTIIELYDNKHFHNDAKYIINCIFKKNLDLPEQYKQHFANLKFDDGVNEIVKIKQSILKKTNIWPSHYDSKYLLHFEELVSISTSNDKPFCKDIILYIAGCLFV